VEHIAISVKKYYATAGHVLERDTVVKRVLRGVCGRSNIDDDEALIRFLYLPSIKQLTSPRILFPRVIASKPNLIGPSTCPAHWATR
jgi:hypothetical protein